jgi:hypothetical protein
MPSRANPCPEIESFNLADLNVVALDTRLELTMAAPEWIICTGNCSTNLNCGENGGCVCHKYN